MRRHVLGILSILFLLVGLVLYFEPSLLAGDATMWSGIGVRVGTVLAVIWLAYPHLEVLPKSFILVIILSGVILARWKQVFPVAIVIIVAIMILRPRTPRKGRGS